MTRLPCVRGRCVPAARVQRRPRREPRLACKAGLKGSFVDLRDKLSTLQPQFVYKNNPPVALRATAPFTQGGLVAEHHSFADQDNLLTPASLHRGALLAILHVLIHLSYILSIIKTVAQTLHLMDKHFFKRKRQYIKQQRFFCLKLC